jgi:hypothetical protein
MPKRPYPRYHRRHDGILFSILENPLRTNKDIAKATGYTPPPGIAHRLLARLSSAIRNHDARGSSQCPIQVVGPHHRERPGPENHLICAISSASVRSLGIWCAVPCTSNRKFLWNWRIAAHLASEVRASELISFISSAHLCAKFLTTLDSSRHILQPSNDSSPPGNSKEGWNH